MQIAESEYYAMQKVAEVMTGNISAQKSNQNWIRQTEVGDRGFIVEFPFRKLNSKKFSL